MTQKSLYYKLSDILTKNDKKYLLYLSFFTIVIAIVETLGVSIIMPFLSLANDHTLLQTEKYYSYMYGLFDFQEEKNFVIIFGIGILIFYLIRLVLNSLYVYLTVNFIHGRYTLIVKKLYDRYMQLPYKDYIQHNTSSLTKVIVNEAVNITELFWFVLLLLSEILIFLFMFTLLMYINYKITLGISFVIVMTSIFIKIAISQKMKLYGIQREEYQKIFYEILNKSFQNLKMIKLQDENSYANEFAVISEKYAHTRIMSGFLQQIPRYIFEFIGFGLIVAIVLYYLIDNDSNNDDLLSLVSVFILGLYKILPSVTKIFLSYNTILYQYKSLDIIHNDLSLDIEDLGSKEICFKKKISLHDVSFSYDYKNIIKDLNLDIYKNEKIAFIGESGSGKSTLVDIIMGLHKPSSGKIYVDNDELLNDNLQSWRNHFGYIPQSVYLFDGTVAQNVAFGLEIDEEQVIEALKKANIWLFLKEKEGLKTRVGESGVMLSGGQKQRIAIARALYKDPDILILDEATSALDHNTEVKIMDEIYEITQDKTLIIIAHRLSTIKRCEKVYKLENGKIKEVI